MLEYEKLFITLRCQTDSGIFRVRVVGSGSVYKTFFDSVSLGVYKSPSVRVVQENHYYPFGQNMVGIEEKDQQSTSSSAEQKFQYNAKEKLGEFGLFWNDHGARNLDLQTGRWTSIDPLAEKFAQQSPYCGFDNNPAGKSDPTGKSAQDPPGAGYYAASITTRYIGFGLRHPIASLRIGLGVTKGESNISTNATRFATRGEVLFGSKKGQQDEGSENGAFRHTLWQATIAAEFGGVTAKEAGNAHEANPFTDLNERSFENIAEADQTVDLLNNEVGRNIGESNKDADMNELANLVLSEFKTNGLFVATKNEDGNWNVSRGKLSSKKYNQLTEIFKNLNANDRTSAEQIESDKKAMAEMQKLDNGPKLQR